MGTLNEETEMPREPEQIRVGGSLVDAQRIRALADTYGTDVAPFLLRAVREGSPQVSAAAIQALAGIDPKSVSEHALAILKVPDHDSDVRAAAADALSQIHTESVLTALIQATTDSPLVSGAAVRALHEHRSADATARIRETLQSLLDEIARARAEATNTEEERLLARRFRAVAGVDGRSGLLRLLALRAYSDLEADLISWWRTHPDIAVKAAAARELLDGPIENAYAVLTEGLPGANEGHPKEPLGELDNGEVRQTLATASYVALRAASPPDAFGRLSPFFEAGNLRDWFGSKRAEIILLLLLGQLGQNPTSWLWGYADELRRRGTRPDSRWQSISSRLLGGSQLHRGLAAELHARLSGQRR